MSDWANLTAPSSGGGGFVGDIEQVHGLARAFTSRPEWFLSHNSWNLLTTNHIPNGGDMSHTAGIGIKGREVVGVGFGFGVAVKRQDSGPEQMTEHDTEVSWEGAGGCLFIANAHRGESLAFVSNVIPIHSTRIWYILREILYGRGNRNSIYARG
jgi:hypothetical protein